MELNRETVFVGIFHPFTAAVVRVAEGFHTDSFQRTGNDGVTVVLQLGVTMDYSIFLIDRYHEEKPLHATREEAMAAAVVKSFTG